MTITLTFSNNERDEARRAERADAAFSVLWTMQETLRRAARGKGDETAEQQVWAESFLVDMAEALDGAGINLEEMYQ